LLAPPEGLCLKELRPTRFLLDSCSFFAPTSTLAAADLIGGGCGGGSGGGGGGTGFGLGADPPHIIGTSYA